MTIGVGLLISYIVGAIPASYVAGRLARIDLREHGSKNLGATNVLRVLGWRYALPVLLFDVGKGALPASVLPMWLDEPHAWAPAAFGLTAVIGHAFSVFVRFRGGKGVATGAGVFLMLAPASLGVALGVFALVVAVTRYVSVGSILGSVSMPVTRGLWEGADTVFWLAVVLVGFVVFTHRGNVARLMRGEETRIGRRERVTS